jgi:hypothetical protein
MSFSDQAKKVIGTVAPLLGGALGGPLGAAAGGLLAKALGNGDVKAADAAIVSADPQTLLAIKKVETDFKQHLADLGIEEDKILADDRANARARETIVKDWTPRILAYGVVALTFILEGIILLRGQPVGVDGVVLGRILGTLDAATIMVLTYYFGSSVGSASKTDALNQIAVAKS